MSTAIKAICWEYWQENRWRFFVVLTTIVGFSAFLREGPDFIAEFDRLSFPFFAWFEMAGMCWLLYAGQYSPSMGRLGFHRHLYIKPVATHTLVVTRLTLMLCTAISIHLVAALLFYSLAQVQLPIAAPILALVTLTLCTQAIAWALSGAPGTQVVTAVITIALLMWWYLEHIPVSGLPSKTNLMSALGLVPVMAVAAISCFLGVKLDRNNKRLSFARLWAVIISFFDLVFPGRNARLSTPKGAQFWILWRTRGWIAPCVNMVGIVILMLFRLLLPKNRGTFLHEDFLMSLAMINLYAIPPIAAIIIAQQGSKTAGLASYISARPLTNRSLLLNYLKVCLVSLVAGWCVFLLGIGMIGICQPFAGQKSLIYELLTQLRAITAPSGKEVASSLIGYSLYLWTSIGLAGSLILTGRKWPFLCVCALFLYFIFGIAITNVLGSTKLTQVLRILFLWLLSTGCLGGTIYAFIAARRRKYIHRMIPWCALLLFCIFLWHLGSWELLKDPSRHIATMAQVSLIFLPLAAAPLAIAWNRHR